MSVVARIVPADEFDQDLVARVKDGVVHIRSDAEADEVPQAWEDLSLVRTPVHLVPLYGEVM